MSVLLQKTLTIVSTATANATLVQGTHQPADASSASFTLTLPASTPGAQIVVEKIDASTVNTVTVSGTIHGTTGTVVLQLQYETVHFVADSVTGSWRIKASHKSLNSLDFRYNNKAKVFNVVTYGADPTGAVACDSAIASAYTDAVAYGSGVIYFPGGSYKVAATHQITQAGIVWQGDGSQASLIYWYGGAGDMVDVHDATISPIGSASTRAGLTWSGFTLDGTNATADGALGFHYGDYSGGIFMDINVQNFCFGTSYGGAGGTSIGMKWHNRYGWTERTTMIGVDLRNNATCIEFNGLTGGTPSAIKSFNYSHLLDIRMTPKGFNHGLRLKNATLDSCDLSIIANIDSNANSSASIMLDIFDSQSSMYLVNLSLLFENDGSGTQYRSTAIHNAGKIIGTGIIAGSSALAPCTGTGVFDFKGHVSGCHPLQASDSLTPTANPVVVTMAGGPVGTFTLGLAPTYGAVNASYGFTTNTATIASPYTAASIQTALQALPIVGGAGASNVSVSGSNGGPFTVTWTNALAHMNLMLSVNGTGLTTGSVSVKTPCKTAAYTAIPGDLVMCDTSAGNFTVTLPTTPGPGTRVAVRMHATTGAFVPTVAAGGSDYINDPGTTTFALASVGEVREFRYSGFGAWICTTSNPGSGGGGGTAPNVQAFTANGTWTMPSSPAPTKVHCRLIGPGGGGGSGACNVSGAASSGGGGGGGGGVTEWWFDVADLSSTQAVVVGTGGTGGAAQSTNTTAGNAGSIGSSVTSFAGASAGRGSGGGGGGLAVAGTSGSNGAGQFNGFAGGTGSSTGAAGSSGGTATGGAPGGGGGGGVTTAPAGSSGGGGGTTGITATGGSSGGAATGAAGGAGTNTSIHGPGTAGGGGGGNAAGNGGAGGAGGNYGAGGGGGGGVLNGSTSGAGGAGGNGYAVITSYFG